MSQAIKITINPVGQSKVEAIGFNGVGCESATANIERALGGEASATREYKEEWAAAENNEQQHQNW